MGMQAKNICAGIAIVILITAIHSLGASPDTGEVCTQNAELYGGIECLQRVARAIGKPLDPVALITSSKLHSSDKDSAEILVELAREQGLSAVILPSVTTAQLKSSPVPLILHVRGSPYSSNFDCYVLSTKSDSGESVLINILVQSTPVPLDRLAPQRRGRAILISTDTSPPRMLTGGGFGTVYGPWSVIGLLTAGVLVMAFTGMNAKAGQTPSQGRVGQILGSLSQAAVLLIVAAVVGFSTQLLRGNGLVPAAASYENSSGGPQGPDFLVPPARSEQWDQKLVEISPQEALQAHAAGQLFVDTRDVSEFNSGHIRGALLCPAGDVSHWRLHLAGIPLDQPMVVYCGEASCGKGEYVAQFLKSSGFTSVRLYRDGWVKWNGPKEGK
jgi:rhodanese-related sulfurtransferase